MIGFILRAVISALGLWVATRWVDGLRIDDAERRTIERTSACGRC